MTPDPPVLAPGRAPTPFTAAEIRSRCAVGKTIRVTNVNEQLEAGTARLVVHLAADGEDAVADRLGVELAAVRAPQVAVVGVLLRVGLVVGG